MAADDGCTVRSIVGLGPDRPGHRPPRPRRRDGPARSWGRPTSRRDQPGKDLGVVLGLPTKLRIKVEGDPEQVLREGQGRRGRAVHVLVRSRRSSRRSLALIQRASTWSPPARSWPSRFPRTQAAFRDLDKAGRAKKVSRAGHRREPRLRDGRPRPDAHRALRAGDAACRSPASWTRRTRRLPLQRKVGAGLNLAQFRRAMTEGTVRHVGLAESVYMIAAGLGWKLDRVDETLEPAIAPRDLDTEYLRIPAGAAAGIKQTRAGLPRAASWPSASTCRCTWGPRTPATTCSSTASRPST